MTKLHFTITIEKVPEVPGRFIFDLDEIRNILERKFLPSEKRGHSGMNKGDNNQIIIDL